MRIIVFEINLSFDGEQHFKLLGKTFGAEASANTGASLPIFDT